MTTFKPELVAQIMAGNKTQTRRPVWPGEYSESGGGEIVRIYTAQGRLKWAVGRTYAVQPGRGKPQMARYRVLRLRREDVRTISHSDALAEGFSGAYARGLFLATWQEFYDPAMLSVGVTGTEANASLFRRPAGLYDAWVIDFELVVKPVQLPLLSV